MSMHQQFRRVRWIAAATPSLLSSAALLMMPLAASGFPAIGSFDSNRGGIFSLAEGSDTSSLRSGITAAHPGVTFASTGLLTVGFLDTVDTVLLSSTSGDGFNSIIPLDGGEQAALDIFVREGGVAIIFTELNNGAHSAANASLLSIFGLTTTGNVGGTVNVIDPGGNPVTGGPFGQATSFNVFNSGFFNNLGSDAQPLGTLSSGFGLAWIPPDTIEPGSGAVIFVSDSTPLGNGFVGPAILSIVANSVALAGAGGLPPGVRVVDADAAPGGDGLSWDTAFRFLQDALETSVDGPPITEIWVAEGTYNPDLREANPGGTGNRAESFVLVEGVGVYGGFAGGETDLSQRDPVGNETILSGDLLGNDAPPFANRADNSFHVVIADIDLTPATILDGFTIRGGEATQPSNDEEGGGITFLECSPTITNCRIADCRASNRGGGAQIDDASPIFTNCEFDVNHSVTNGGGIAVNGAAAAPQFVDCFFTNNTAQFGAAASLAIGAGVSRFTNCSFTGNDSSGNAGAVQNSTQSIFTSCNFSFNECQDDGGAVTNSGVTGSAKFLLCSFIGNSSGGGDGGAIHNSASAAPQIVSCAFIQNLTNDGDAGAIMNTSAFALIDQCVFIGNHSAVDGGAMRNDASTVFINDSTFWSNSADNLGGAIANIGGASVANRNSILRGSTANGSPNEISGSGHNITFTNIQGGAGGAGNIDADPRFVDADGADGFPGNFDDDVRLRAASPCIDAGSNALVAADNLDLDGDSNTTEPLPLDFILEPRFHDDPGTPDTGTGSPPIVDMGAYEFQGTTEQPSPHPFDASRTLVSALIENAGAADLDDDGDIDLAAFNGSDLIFFQNDGSQPPVFTAEMSYPSQIDAIRIVAADLNGDNEIDLVSGSATADLLLVYDNQSLDPLFEIVVPHSLINLTNVAVGDVNSDGRVDFVVSACADPHIIWFENTGGFNFTQRVIDTGFCAEDVNVADLDRDGDLDVLAALSVATNKTVWYESNGGNPPIWTRRDVATGLNQASSVVAADLDSDGDFDVVSASEVSTTVVWSENNGASPPSFTHRTLATVDSGASQLSIADFDNDGDFDVAAHSEVKANQVVIWIRNNGGSPPTFDSNIIDEAAVAAYAQFPSDLDGDGDPEIVGVYNGNLGYYENLLIHSTATFPPGGVIIGNADGPTSCIPGDVNGDGKNDVIVASFFDDTVSWFENPGPPVGGPAWEKHIIVGPASGAFRPDGPSCVAAGDIDHDGDLDVASTSIIDGKVQWYESDGNGAFTPRLVILDPVPQASFVRVTDINSDGLADILLTSAGIDQVGLGLNDGGQPPFFGTNLAASGLDSVRCAWEGDIDGDGDLDFVTASHADDTIAWHENNGAAFPDFTEHVISNLAQGAVWCQPIDADADGDVDILTASLFDNTVEVYLSDGDPDPVFTPALSDSGVFGASSVWGNDADNDGDIDLMATARYADAIVGYENDAGVLLDGVLSSINDGIQWAAFVDMNNDSFPDIVSASFADDKIKIFFNEGGQFAFVNSISTAPATISDGSTDDLLRLRLNHGGRQGDGDVEFASLSVRLTRPDGTPLTVPQSSALFNGFEVFADSNESGSFESGLDTSIGSAGDGAYNGSSLQISIPDDQADALVSFSDGSLDFFFVVTLENTASGQPQNQFRVTFDPGNLPPVVEDADFDVALKIADPRILTSPTVTAVTDFLNISPGGLGIPCSADFNHDNHVDSSDLNMLLSSWGAQIAPGEPGDASGDGFVGSLDLNILLSEWGANCQ